MVSEVATLCYLGRGSHGPKTYPRRECFVFHCRRSKRTAL